MEKKLTFVRELKRTVLSFRDMRPFLFNFVVLPSRKLGFMAYNFCARPILIKSMSFL